MRDDLKLTRRGLFAATAGAVIAAKLPAQAEPLTNLCLDIECDPLVTEGIYCDEFGTLLYVSPVVGSALKRVSETVWGVKPCTVAHKSQGRSFAELPLAPEDPYEYDVRWSKGIVIRSEHPFPW